MCRRCRQVRNFAVIEGPLNEAVPFTFRLKFPADYNIPAHWHPAIEACDGAIASTWGREASLIRKKTKALTPGSAAIMQPKTNHADDPEEVTSQRRTSRRPRRLGYCDLSLRHRPHRERSVLTGNIWLPGGPCPERKPCWLETLMANHALALIEHPAPPALGQRAELRLPIQQCAYRSCPRILSPTSSSRCIPATAAAGCHESSRFRPNTPRVPDVRRKSQRR